MFFVLWHSEVKGRRNTVRIAATRSHAFMPEGHSAQVFTRKEVARTGGTIITPVLVCSAQDSGNSGNHRMCCCSIP